METDQKIKIVDYKPGDYGRLIALWQASGLSYKPEGRDSRERIAKEVHLSCNRFLFARLGDLYIGTVLVTHDGRKGWINRLAVLPDYRNKGVARLLVDHAEAWLDREGIHIVACQIEPDNPESLEVFKRLNYIPFEGMHYLTKRKYPEI